MHHLVLRSTIGGEEFAGKVHDRVAVPHHRHARILGHGRDDLGLEVLLLGVARNSSTSSAATSTAIRSCDSEIASSVPSRPSYFFDTLLRSTYRPSASSPTATDTPPAPKSLQRLIRRHASPRRNRRCSLRSTGALPFCTSAPSSSSDSTLCALEAPVAPPMPSRPVRPPSRMTLSPGAGVSRRT